MNINEDTGNSNRLEELGGSDFKIVDGQPNIKGWDVKDTSGMDVGEVDELIFDPASRKVLYVVVDIKDNKLDLRRRKVLVPIGLATLHEKDDEVIIAPLTALQLNEIPEYEKGNITAGMEATIRNTFTGLAAAVASGASSYESHPKDFYQHEHFNEENFYGPRRNAQHHSVPVIEETLNIRKQEVESGGVRVTSNIVERGVEVPVSLREEHVLVDRTPADRLATEADFQTFQAGEIELTESKEVPVVSKQARVIEEVTVSKTSTESEEVIRDTIRITQVDAEEISRDQERGSNI